jgi:bla regulator protein BlaR1
MSKMRYVVTAFLLIATSAILVAQGTPEFDVVSIKPTVSNRGGGPGPFVNTSTGRLFARGPLLFLLQYAYGLQPFQFVETPGWATSDRFDLEAKEPHGGNHYTQFPQMLRPVLADRFKLATHRETRQSPIYALVVARSGPKLAAAHAGDEAGTRGGSGQLVAKRMTMRAFASLLSRMTSRLVQDHTALDGEFNFTLTWTPDDFQRPDPLGRAPATAEAPSLFTALQEQLGLRLESTRAPVDVLVIDHVERPSED